MVWVLLGERNNLLGELHARSTWVYALVGCSSLAPGQQTQVGFIIVMALLLLRSRRKDQVVWRKERSSSNAVQAKNWRLLEEMWTSKLVYYWRELIWPGCPIKLIVTALTLREVSVLVNYLVVILWQEWVCLPSSCLLCPSWGAWQRQQEGLQEAQEIAGAREVSEARWKEVWTANWKGWRYLLALLARTLTIWIKPWVWWVPPYNKPKPNGNKEASSELTFWRTPERNLLRKARRNSQFQGNRQRSCCFSVKSCPVLEKSACFLLSQNSPLPWSYGHFKQDSVRPRAASAWSSSWARRPAAV